MRVQKGQVEGLPAEGTCQPRHLFSVIAEKTSALFNSIAGSNPSHQPQDGDGAAPAVAAVFGTGWTLWYSGGTSIPSGEMPDPSCAGEF